MAGRYAAWLPWPPWRRGAGRGRTGPTMLPSLLQLLLLGTVGPAGPAGPASTRRRARKPLPSVPEPLEPLSELRPPGAADDGGKLGGLLGQLDSADVPIGALRLDYLGRRPLLVQPAHTRYDSHPGCVWGEGWE